MMEAHDQKSTEHDRRTNINVDMVVQDIDLTDGEHVKLLDHLTNRWVDLTTDFSNSYFIEIMGIKVPVISRKELISYKKILNRPVDRLDIQDIEIYS